jgi:hypothetical protein
VTGLKDFVIDFCITEKKQTAATPDLTAVAAKATAAPAAAAAAAPSASTKPSAATDGKGPSDSKSAAPPVSAATAVSAPASGSSAEKPYVTADLTPASADEPACDLQIDRVRSAAHCTGQDGCSGGDRWSFSRLIGVMWLVLCLWCVRCVLSAVQLWVIEINPWGPSTDCGLFDYRSEHDKVMANGPFQLRVRSTIAPGARDFVASAEKDMK